MHFIDMSYPDDLAQTPDGRTDRRMDGRKEGRTGMDGDECMDRQTDRQTARLIHSTGLIEWTE